MTIMNTIPGGAAFKVAQLIINGDGSITTSFQIGVVNEKNEFNQLVAQAYGLTAAEAAGISTSVSADADMPMLEQLQDLVISKLRELGRICF